MSLRHVAVVVIAGTLTVGLLEMLHRRPGATTNDVTVAVAPLPAAVETVLMPRLNRCRAPKGDDQRGTSSSTVPRCTGLYETVAGCCRGIQCNSGGSCHMQSMVKPEPFGHGAAGRASDSYVKQLGVEEHNLAANTLRLRRTLLNPPFCESPHASVTRPLYTQPTHANKLSLVQHTANRHTQTTETSQHRSKQ